MKLIATIVASLLLLVGCKDPHACQPGDIDRDHDGRCHEK